MSIHSTTYDIRGRILENNSNQDGVLEILWCSKKKEIQGMEI